MIGLALSGGGSRAIAFHLGCMRTLNDRGILTKTNVISSVSGGSVIAGMYAYSNYSFEEFDQRVVWLLQQGLQWSMFRNLFVPKILFKILATNIVSQPIALIAGLLGRQAPFRRWASRSDALERALENIYHGLLIGQPQRPNVEVIFNACELGPGSAFRFASSKSGSWRFGKIDNIDILVAHAVACSAAFPLLLPAFDEEYIFSNNDRITRERVILTDGGVYDNLGISCLEPDKNNDYTLHKYPVDYIICCNAGHGQLSGTSIPYGAITRIKSSFENIFRKAQDSAVNRLHMFKQDGRIKGFILPYLGQQDQALPIKPPDLIRREEVIDYPTNFAAMTQRNITLLTKRGEQLTELLLSTYCPEL